MHFPDSFAEPKRIGNRRRAGSISHPPPNSTVLVWLLVSTAIAEVIGNVTAVEVRTVPFLIFLPYLIAGVGTVGQTVFAAVWVDLFLIVSLLLQPLPSLFGTLTIIIIGLILGALSVWRCQERIAREREILRLRSASVALQQQVLLPLPWRTERFIVDGLYEPMVEESRIGGDIYDIANSPYGVRVLIADVQGKGPYAIGTAFAVLGAFREAAHRERTLAAVVTAMDEAVMRYNSYAARVGRPERFVTALVLCFDDVDGGKKAEAVNCGHVPLYRLHRKGSGPVLHSEPNVPLGLGSLAQGPRRVEWFDFPPDTTLLLCTDGVTEARSPSGEFFPLSKRLSAWSRVPPAELVDTIRTDLHRFTHGDVLDDIAILTIRHASATSRLELEYPRGRLRLHRSTRPQAR